MAENGTDRGLSSGQQRAIVALLSERTVAEAAEQARVGERTIWRWLADPAFKAALVTAEGEMIDVATRRLLALQAGAIEMVERIMLDEAAGAHVRLRAAQALIDYLLKLRELRNIEARLARLEAELVPDRQ